MVQKELFDKDSEVHEKLFERPYKILPLSYVAVEVTTKSVKLYLNGKLLTQWRRDD